MVGLLTTVAIVVIGIEIGIGMVVVVTEDHGTYRIRCLIVAYMYMSYLSLMVMCTFLFRDI